MVSINEKNNSLITDYEHLYRFSGMIDSLRDSSKFLYRMGNPNPESVVKAENSLNHLIEEVKKCLRLDIVSELQKVTLHLDESSTIEEVFLKASQVSQFLDTVHQTPEFLLGMKVRKANADAVQEQIENSQNNEKVNSNVLHFGIGQN